MATSDFKEIWGIQDAEECISREAQRTIQDGPFRPYARKFILLEAKDKNCKYPLGPSQLRILFLQNMRNRQLRDLLLKVTGSISDLSNVGQEAIANGHIPDFQGGKRGYNSNSRVQKNRSRGQSNFGRSNDTLRSNYPVQGGQAFYIKKLTREQLDLLGLEPVDDVIDDFSRNWNRRQR